jgi:DUF4097 and DUF4098 domain-containing protein YvlB
MKQSTSLTLFALAAAVAVAPAQARAQKDRDRDRQRERELTRVDSTFAFDKGSRVDVSIASGEIIITGWTRPEAKVVASTERGWIDTQLSSHHITLQTHTDRGHSGPARVEIMVPIGTRVEANSASGSIRITGTDGEVGASSASGAIEVLGATDRISVQTAGGKIHVAKLKGRTRLETISATLEAEDVAGDINAETVSGRITLTNIKSSHAKAETVNASVTYSGSIDPTGSYDFESHSGNVHLELPDNSAGDLFLETFSGRISSAFPITLQPGDISAMARHGKKMQFMIGKGGARITASTFSGNIIIDKSGRLDREEN